MSETYFHRILAELQKETVEFVMQRFSEFVRNNDLVVCREGAPSIVELTDTKTLEKKYTVAQSVTFELKDREYIKDLELENKKLKTFIHERLETMLASLLTREDERPDPTDSKTSGN